MATQERRPGAVRVGGPGEHRKRGGWLKWLLLLLALLVLIALLVALLGGDDDDGGASSSGATTQQEASGTGGAGTLVAEGQSLLPAGAGVMRGRDEATATGENVRVVAVNPEEGFWVGTSDTDRVYVEYGDVRQDEPENAYQPKVDDVVNLTGPVEDAPPDPVEALNLEDERDGRLITEQGGFINADEVTKAE